MRFNEIQFFWIDAGEEIVKLGLVLELELDGKEYVCVCVHVRVCVQTSPIMECEFVRVLPSSG